MLTILPIIIALLVVLVFRLINKKFNPPIFGVYQRRNKYFWTKFLCMYFYLRLKQLVVHLRWLLAVELGTSFDGTVHIHEHDVQLEEKGDLGEHPLAVDAVYFNGMSKKGDAVVCRISRRQHARCEAFMCLKVNGEDLLLSPELPNTCLEQTHEEEGDYRVGSMAITNFIPMRTWKLSYNGEMKCKTDPEKRVPVAMELTWSAHWQAFNNDVHMSPRSLAKDIAKEQWSKDFFKNIKKLRQSHYEQMGFLEGNVSIDGKKHLLKMPCVRDHTKGPVRDWRNYHRYVLHFIYLENGDCMEIGSVSQSTLSHVTIGYLCRKADQAVLPVKYCDFQLWSHGENQTMPQDYGFVFRAGGERYDVRVEVLDQTHLYMGQLKEAKLYERWCRVDVNGVRGWACAEWQYHNAGVKA